MGRGRLSSPKRRCRRIVVSSLRREAPARSATVITEDQRGSEQPSQRLESSHWTSFLRCRFQLSESAGTASARLARSGSNTPPSRAATAATVTL